MILRALHLENYKQYGLLDLEFREGLVGIIGRNGAGKSTLFEAILYCLFGRDESNKLLIRSSFADPKSTVILALQFAVGPVEYAVKREFRGKAMAVNAELFKNDQLIAKGVAPVNEEIGKILNMEREAFKRSVFSGQSELSELSKTKGEERKRMVRKMLGLDTLDEVQTRINAEVRDLASQVTGQRQNLLDPEVVQVMEAEIKDLELLFDNNSAALQSEQEKLKQVETEFGAARQKFEVEDQRQKQYHALRQETGRLQERREGLERQGTELATKIGGLQEQQARLESQKTMFAGFEADKKQLQQLETERQRQINRETYLSQIEELQTPLRESRDLLEQLEKELAGKDKLMQARTDKKTAMESVVRQIEQKLEVFNALKNQVAALNSRVEERRNKILHLQEIGRAGTCPTCFQPVLDAYDAVLAQLNGEINTLQKEELAALEEQKQQITHAGQQLRDQQSTLQKELDLLQEEENRLRELEKQKIHTAANLKNYEAQATRIQVILREIGEVHFDASKYGALKQQVEATEPRFLQFSNELAYVARELPAAEKALQQTGTAIAETAKQLEARQAELAQTAFDADRYETVKQALTRFGNVYAEQTERTRNLEKTGLELRNTIDQQRSKLLANERIREQVSAKLAEIDLLKKLGELLLQFKTEILERVSPSISREASNLFSRITKGKYERIHVDESFDFAIADGGVLYPIERFSGGEVDLANFCLRIAITKAIMELGGNGQGVEFLAFDEIFGSQDEERRHEMMLALNYLQEQFRQIYIVSHIESQKDYFPNLLEVTYRPEGSVVKWV